MAAKSREMVATFEREIVAFENDAGQTRVIIAEVRDENGKLAKVKGEANEGRLKSGLAYKFFGYPAHHHKYGDQFVFTSFSLLEPKGEHATRVYLEQCGGIGPAKSRDLWKAFGENAVQMLREKPDECVRQVKGLTAEKAHVASGFLTSIQKCESTKIEVLGLLHGRGMPKKLIDDLLDKYGVAAATTIKRNPYLLMQFRGIGFLKADKLYVELGHDPARLKRQALCVWYAIARNSSGDTWFPRRMAEAAVREMISGSAVNPEKAIRLALRAGMLAERTDGFGVRWLAEYRKSLHEIRCAECVAQAIGESQESASAWPDSDLLNVSEHQQEQAGRAMAGRIGILAGRPGTGKTYTVAAIIKELVSRVGGVGGIAACAPTGKAAVRFTEALNAAGVEIQARTIHSLLRVAQIDDAEGWGFEHGLRNPLPYSFVFVDESSMIDAGLMSSLLMARGTGTSILFVGDTNQLAPVGHGAPLRDMIAAGVPCGELTEIRRNAGQIVATCKEIVERKRLVVAERINLDTGDNLAIVQKEQAREQIDMLTRCMERLRDDPERKIDPVWGVQIIVAVNKKSELGRKPLNRTLQDLLNPETDTNSVSGCPFRVGDKIICTKNGQFPDAESAGEKRSQKTEDTKIYVANGEQAEVIRVEPRRLIARLTAPDRLVIIPRGEQNEQADEARDLDSDDTGTGCCWELAYAISCHRSQGSEWPVVIVMIDEHQGAQMVCTRNWIYTAISRAKKWCLLIGKKTVAEQMLTRDGIKNRKTFLREMLTDVIAGGQRAGEITDASEFVEDWLDLMIEELTAV